MKKRFILLFFSVFLLPIAVPTSVFSQTEDRIIRADREESDDVIEIVSIRLGETPVKINETFSGDENWLKQLTIRVRNISGRDITCLVIAPGLLERMDYKLALQESWGWRLPFSLGCSNRKGRKAVFKKGAEIELGYENADPFVFKNAPLGSFHKAVLEWAIVIYKNEKKETDVLLRLPSDTRYLEDRSH